MLKVLNIALQRLSSLLPSRFCQGIKPSRDQGVPTDNKRDRALEYLLREPPNRRIGYLMGLEEIREEAVPTGGAKTKMMEKDARVDYCCLGMGREGLEKAGSARLFQAEAHKGPNPIPPLSCLHASLFDIEPEVAGGLSVKE